MTEIQKWMHDDITWCSEEGCPVKQCRRNTAIMITRVGIHSYADFKGTDECMVSDSLDECMDGCLHAKECFAKHEDPDEALRELEEMYCDECEFSSLEED